MEIEKDIFIKQYGKKAYRKFCKKNRVQTMMNTGTRTIRTEKTYSRKQKHKTLWNED